jgi:SNF2 family DNA or RNA helicase
VLPLLQRRNLKGIICTELLKAELDIIEVVLKELGIRYIRIDGSTPDSVRKKFLHAFQCDGTIQVLISTTKCLGEAVTLTAAYINIFFSINYNPEVVAQAESRFSRRMYLLTT